MKTSSKGKALIKRFEKYIEQVYDDGYGNLTVGYVLSGKLNDAPSGRLFRADFRTLQMCQSL